MNKNYKDKVKEMKIEDIIYDLQEFTENGDSYIKVLVKELISRVEE